MLGLSSDLISTSNIVGNIGGEPYQNNGNWSGTFDGVGDIATIDGSAPEGHVLKPTAAISISFWVKPENWNYAAISGQASYDKRYMVSNLFTGGYSVHIERSSSNTLLKFQIGVADNGTGSAGYIEASTSSLNGLTGFKHIVATYDGTTAKMFINNSASLVTNGAHGTGSAEAIDYTTNGAGVQVTEVGIGGNPQHSPSDGTFISALFDDVAIFNVALDTTNIGEIYNSGTPFDLRSNSSNGNYDKSGNLVGYWTFDEGVGVTVNDFSSNINNATLSADATFSSTTP